MDPTVDTSELQFALLGAILEVVSKGMEKLDRSNARHVTGELIGQQLGPFKVIHAVLDNEHPFNIPDFGHSANTPKEQRLPHGVNRFFGLTLWVVGPAGSDWLKALDVYSLDLGGLYAEVGVITHQALVVPNYRILPLTPKGITAND